MDTLTGSTEVPVPKQPRRIVVGVDGSESSVKALDWAIEQARQWHAVVDVVTAWTFPMVEGYAFTHTVDDVEDAAREVMESAVSRIAEAAPEITVRGDTTDGDAGPVLVDAANGADLLVVGSRGVGGLERLFLGSIGAYCARHAACSVMIVR